MKTFIRCLCYAVLYKAITLEEAIEALEDNTASVQPFIDNNPPINGETGSIYLHRLASILNKPDTYLISKFNAKKIIIPFTTLDERFFSRFCNQPAIKPEYVEKTVKVKLVALAGNKLKITIKRNGKKKAYTLRQCELVSDGKKPNVTKTEIPRPVKNRPIKPLSPYVDLSYEVRPENHPSFATLGNFETRNARKETITAIADMRIVPDKSTVRYATDPDNQPIRLRKGK